MDEQPQGRRWMPAITLWQPWATWIACGWKTIEVRTHNRFRSLVGRQVAIHAGRAFDPRATETALAYMSAEQRAQHEMMLRERRYRLEAGHVLCIVRIADCRRLDDPDGRHALCPVSGRYGYWLDALVRLEPPIRAQGYQGIWYWEVPEGLRQVCEETQAATREERRA